MFRMASYRQLSELKNDMTDTDEEKASSVSEKEEEAVGEEQAFLPQDEHAVESIRPGVNRRYWFSVAVNTAAAVSLVGIFAVINGTNLTQ